MKLSNSQEEYLVTIYDLSLQNKKVRVTDIANKLDITKPSVNKAINNLKELGFISYEKYSDIILNKSGEEMAKEILRKQDILYIFLNKIIGVEDRVAIAESISMKHAISEDTAEKLNKYIFEKFNLECDFDVSNKLCKTCIKLTDKLKK